MFKKSYKGLERLEDTKRVHDERMEGQTGGWMEGQTQPLLYTAALEIGGIMKNCILTLFKGIIYTLLVDKMRRWIRERGEMNALW